MERVHASSLPASLSFTELTTKKLTVTDELVLPNGIEKPHLVTGGVGFSNGWSDYGSGYTPAAFWKDPFGVVHIQGFITGGSVGATAFTLPVAYRPSTTHIFSGLSSGPDTVAQIEVTTSGQVCPATGVNGWVTLNGITFRL